ncbi:MAG: lipocalin family protein [Pyrinomonadaceae bacterium]
MNVFIIFLLVLIMSVMNLFGQGSPTELKTVNTVNIERYAGRWYEIAKYPNRFQKSCISDTTADYLLKSNGRIEVTNRCIKKDGKINRAVGEAKIVDKATNAKLKVRFAPGFLSFLPFVWGDYWIVELADDYSHVVVAEPGRDYFWILARKPEMDDKTYQAILTRAESMGLKPSRVERTIHKTASQSVTE